MVTVMATANPSRLPVMGLPQDVVAAAHQPALGLM
jgi:TPP-dependent trihydroxycyclohexane-1,2-dione (THcHDO) dehydratase